MHRNPCHAPHGEVGGESAQQASQAAEGGAGDVEEHHEDAVVGEAVVAAGERVLGVVGGLVISRKATHGRIIPRKAPPGPPAINHQLWGTLAELKYLSRFDACLTPRIYSIKRSHEDKCL